MEPVRDAQAGPPPLASAAGQRLVRDVMRRDFITASTEESLLDALRTMRLARLRHLAVQSGGVLVGVLSYRDLQDELLGPLEELAPAPPLPTLADTTLGERVAAALPFCIASDATLAEAVARIERLRVGCLPVVEPGEQGPRLVGLVTELDLLRAGYATP
jgi:CBS-domain-containing membrane protein